MSSLKHLPKIMMVSDLTLASYSPMDPHVHIESALKSSGLKPPYKNANVNASKSALVISLLHTVDDLLLWKTATICMLPLAL